MPYQFEFDFGDHGPRRPKRPEAVFFALLLDGTPAKRTEIISKQVTWDNGIHGSFLLPSRYHVSLQHVRNMKRVEPKVVYGATLAAAAVSMPAFDVTFDQAISFPGHPRRGKPQQYPTVLVGGSDPLFELHSQLAQSMRKFGFEASDGFIPHVTMVYGDKMIAPQPIEPLRWTVRDFALIHSERGLTKYNILGRWPLRG